MKIDNILNELKDIPIKVSDYKPEDESRWQEKTAKKKDVYKYDKSLKDREEFTGKQKQTSNLDRKEVINNIQKTLLKLSDEGLMKVNKYVKMAGDAYAK